MTNAIYPKWKDAIQEAKANSALTGSGATGLWVALVDTGAYTYDAADEFYSDLAGVIAEAEVENVVITDGVVDGDDVSLPGVSGNSVEALVFYRKNAGANTTWYLVAYIDTGQTGLPVTPNGGTINIAWHSSGIFFI